MVTEASQGDQAKVIGKLTEFTKTSVEPVGVWYRNFWLESNQLQSPSTGSGSVDLDDGVSDDDDDDSSNDFEIEDDITFLRSLDPKEWKKQDHYAVLGIGKFKLTVNDDQIKKAYRKKVLLHHPDKRRSRGEKVHDAKDDYFTCITKAYEVLGNSLKRMSYDSVDPDFEDAVPPVNANSKENFYKVFTVVFKDNARWSNKTPVPLLGNAESTFEEVDSFYSFWYNFDSWREFSYLDEEEKEKGESREERKWIEKQNKVARLKLKKEENTRIRQLVDNSYACDPRVQRFKEEEKNRKLAQKKAKQDAARAKIEEEERRQQAILDAERRAKEKKNEEAKIQADAAKKAKDALRRLLKKEQSCLRATCKEFNYFVNGDSEIVNNMSELDKMCELLPLNSIEELNKELVNCNAETGREIFLREVKILNDKLEKEKAETIYMGRKTATSGSKSSSQKNWAPDDVQLLIKAVNLFPAGTNQRWDVVANYINQHSLNAKELKRNAKEVLTKAKDLQKSDMSMKDEANKQAYQRFEKTQKSATATPEESVPTERFDTAAEMQGFNPAPWTADEQRLLEQALKTYSGNASNRWESIAECLPGRSKKDCMKRYKDLVEMVKAKKAAQAPVSGNKKVS